jgi:hypothetical protein
MRELRTRARFINPLNFLDSSDSVRAVATFVNAVWTGG